MTAYPLDDTEYLAEDLRMFHAGRTPGLFNITGEDFEVKSAGGMNISVSNGLAFLKASSDGVGGIVYSPKDETTLTATVATNYTRYDYVAIRYDKISNSCGIVYQEGTQSMPTPIRNLEQYELIIAVVALKASAGEITQEMIQDVRLNESYCGLTVDTLTNVPTQELYNQFQSFYERIQKENEEFQNSNNEKFSKWFASVKDTLDSDTAGKLMNRIANVEQMLMNNHFTTILLSDDGTLVDENGQEILADWAYEVESGEVGTDWTYKVKS